MFKNVSGQKIQLFVFDVTTGNPKTGDAANITAYVSKDHGSVTVLGDTSATEMDATNAKGVYLFDLTQGETNADELTFTAKSSTSNISSTPRFIETKPPNHTSLSIDSNGRVDVIKIAGTTQTPRDVGLSVLLSTGTGTGQLDFTSGVVKANAVQWLGGTIPAVNVTGVPLIDLKYTLGTISPATAGSVRADAVTGTVGSVTARVTANTDQLAGQTVTAAAGVTFPASVASPTNITAGTITTATNLTNAPTVGDLTSTMKTSVENAVWDATSASHVTAGTTGKKLSDASAAGTPPTVTQIADEVQTRTIAAVTTVTNLTNAPTSGDLTATMKASVTTAATASTPALSTAGNAAVADKLLGRNLAGGSDGTRTVKDALRSLRNKTSIAGGTLTVTEEDDTTTAWSATVTTAAGDPLTSIDPA